MIRRFALLTFLVLALLGSVARAADPPKSLQVAAVGRLPFPERGFIVDLPEKASFDHDQVSVSENGRAVGAFAFAPLATSGVRYGVVLAVDSSESMAGAPFRGALAAAGKFGARRGTNERVGLVSFNAAVRTLLAPDLSRRALDKVLAHPPKLAYGTHIYDALNRSIDELVASRVGAGSIVLLSDGADVGSRSSLSTVVRRATERHIRIFTVGLRSGAFDPQALTAIAQGTGGSYAEASSTAQLAPIYTALGNRLAKEFLLQYRSNVAPHSRVVVRIAIDGAGASTVRYVAPTPSGLPPFHRSLVTRFVLSPISLAVLALATALLAAFIIRAALEQTRSGLVERVSSFVGEPKRERLPQLRRRTRHATTVGAEHARGLLSGLERDLEIANVDMTATKVAGYTVAATLVVFILLALVSPVVAVLAILVPFIARGIVKRKLKQVRDQFADQLAPNLQVLASALRTGHSFAGALAMVVEHAHEPSKRELRHAVADEQLGVYMDEAIHRVAIRMDSRDLEQVALLAELQRTTGGNAAEVLDTVVGTIRERGEVRRLVRTLTAQGRMARWILTILPIVTGLGSYLLQPDVVSPMLRTIGGQIAYVAAAFMVAIGSMVIQRIVDVKV